jgi:hypothetical protein
VPGEFENSNHLSLEETCSGEGGEAMANTFVESPKRVSGALAAPEASSKDLSSEQGMPMVVWIRGDEEYAGAFVLDADQVMEMLSIKRSRLTQISGRELRVGKKRIDRYIKPVYRQRDVKDYLEWTRPTASHKRSSRLIDDALDSLKSLETKILNEVKVSLEDGQKVSSKEQKITRQELRSEIGQVREEVLSRWQQLRAALGNERLEIDAQRKHLLRWLTNLDKWHQLEKEKMLGLQQKLTDLECQFLPNLERNLQLYVEKCILACQNSILDSVTRVRGDFKDQIELSSQLNQQTFHEFATDLLTHRGLAGKKVLKETARARKLSIRKPVNEVAIGAKKSRPARLSLNLKSRR